MILKTWFTFLDSRILALILTAMKLYWTTTAVCLCVLPFLVSAAPESPPLKSLLTGKTYLHFNCSFCEIGVTAVKTLIKLHVSDDFIAKTCFTICEKFHIEDSVVCDGLVHAFKVRLSCFLYCSLNSCLIMY